MQALHAYSCFKAVDLLVVDLDLHAAVDVIQKIPSRQVSHTLPNSDTHAHTKLDYIFGNMCVSPAGPWRGAVDRALPGAAPPSQT